MTAKSILVTNFGGYDNLKVADYPLLPPKDNEVEVEVYYCGLNFADLYIRQGMIPNKHLPFVLGIECSGIITAVGPNTNDNYKIGQKVICYDYTGGLFRKKLIISSKKCYIIPNGIGLDVAAAILVNYMTAYFSLMELGNLKPKQHVLINSCAGGVGWAATQLASLVDGVVLYGTTSSSKTRKAKENGINYVLSYDDLEEQLTMLCPNGLDLVIDNTAGNNVYDKMNLLKSFGRIVLIGANDMIPNEQKIPIESLLKGSDVALKTLIMNSVSVSGLHLGYIAQRESQVFQEALTKIFQLFLEKKINPRIHCVLPFEDVVEATKLLQERKNIGKVLLSTGME